MSRPSEGAGSIEGLFVPIFLTLILTLLVWTIAQAQRLARREPKN